jgi:hypothetical protein
MSANWNLTMLTGTKTRFTVPNTLQQAEEVWITGYYLDAAKASDASYCKGASYALAVGDLTDPCMRGGPVSALTTATGQAEVRGYFVVDGAGATQEKFLQEPVLLLRRERANVAFQYLELSLEDRLGQLETAGTAITRAGQGASKPILTLYLRVTLPTTAESTPVPSAKWQRDAPPAIRLVQ